MTQRVSVAVDALNALFVCLEGFPRSATFVNAVRSSVKNINEEKTVDSSPIIDEDEELGGYNSSQLSVEQLYPTRN